MELHAAGILAALTATVLAGHGAADRAAGTRLAATFGVAAFVFARVGLPPVDALAFCAGAVLAAALARPRWSMLPPVGAGVFGAAWISILIAQGLPWPPAAAVAASVVAVAFGLAVRRPAFVSGDVRDEALLLVGSFALLLAVAPAVVDGWHSAGALAAEPLGEAGPEIGPWLSALAAGSMLLGGAYALWQRR